MLPFLANINRTVLIYSPLEQFEVTTPAGFYLFGIHLALTNLGLYVLLTVGIIITFHLFRITYQLVPTK